MLIIRKLDSTEKTKTVEKLGYTLKYIWMKNYKGKVVQILKLL